MHNGGVNAVLNIATKTPDMPNHAEHKNTHHAWISTKSEYTQVELSGAVAEVDSNEVG
jgi:hypothetical protein